MDWFKINTDGSSERFNIEDITTETSFGADMNSLGSYFVPLELLAEKLIKAGDNETKLEKIHRGWFNKFYERKHIEKDENDILSLSNGVAEWIIPKDTAKIYLTIDNQKDHLYAQVTAVGYGVIPQIVYFGRIETWGDAEEMWEICQHLEGEDGETYMASKMGIDRRGYNEGQIRRTDEADEFVNYMTQKWGEDRIYGMEGHPDITGGKAFTVVNHKDYSDQRYEIKVKIVKFSNLYIKNQLFRCIDRAIIKERSQTEDDEGFGYSGKLFYINQDHIEIDKKGTKEDSLTKMLTAEVFDYAKHPKTGKLAEEKSWIPIRKRNDAIDTSSMALAFSEMDKISLLKKPSGEDLASALSGLGDFG
jgi:hypothetical protein